jgi:uncharacterized Ntn-hydrolase superfamily protein
MTYSILARCTRTGQLGLGVASYSIAVGLYSDAAVRRAIGATFTQGNPLPRNNRLALNLLAQGWGPGPALRQLSENDAAFQYRQIGIVDREGEVAVHSGRHLRGWAGHRLGDGWVALGDMAAGEKVLDAMANAFEEVAQEDLDVRLLAALEAGRDAGGLVGKTGRLAERSATLVVWGVHDYSDMDLRVDLHERAVDELRRIHTDYKPTASFYDERARNPRAAVSAMTFAETLRQQRAKATP